MVQKQKKEIEKKKEGHGQMRRRRRRRSVGEIRKPQEMAEAVSSVRQLARRRERERETAGHAGSKGPPTRLHN